MMATEIYRIDKVETVDGIEIELSPLKIKYMRQFMEAFKEISSSTDQMGILSVLSECVRIAMKQFYPKIKTVNDVEDSFDIASIYKIVEIVANIKIKSTEEDDTEDQKDSENSTTWENLDLAKLEAEVFEIGVWKNFEDLETSISMSELMILLETRRDLDYQEKKFFAAIQGVDLDKETGKGKEDAWEKMKAKVFSGGKTSDPNDITSFRGHKAAKAGFGVGMGLGYEDMTKK